MPFPLVPLPACVGEGEEKPRADDLQRLLARMVLPFQDTLRSEALMQYPDYNPTPPRDEIKPGEQEPGFVDCDACLEQIPESIAIRPDAGDYIRHFCGLACYNEWLKRRPAEMSDNQA